MKVSELSLKTITIIQVLIALVVSLIFQFVVPLAWQPLGEALPPEDAGPNLVFFTASQWFFSFSVAWLFNRDNPYVNNFLIMSFIPNTMIVVDEFFILGVYTDWYHLIPYAIDCYILWKKRETLDQKYILYYTVIITLWLYIGYFLDLAYFGASLLEFVVRWSILLALTIPLSYFFRKKDENLIDLPAT